MKKTIVITGAGSGIGRAISVALSHKAENSLILIGRRKSELENTIKLLQNPNQHCLAAIDVRDSDSWNNFCNENETLLNNSYAIIAAAGIGGENNYGTNDRWDDIISTNLTGTYTSVSTLLPYFKKSKHNYKHILLISSILANLGVPNYTAYCASKAGLLGLMRSWAAELAQQKILVNALCPGWVETEMAKTGIKQFAAHTGVDYETAKQQQLAFVPTKKMATPEEIAHFVAYLIDEKQTSFTGESFNLNNGALML